MNKHFVVVFCYVNTFCRQMCSFILSFLVHCFQHAITGACRIRDPFFGIRMDLYAYVLYWGMVAKVYTTHWTRTDGTKAWAGGKHLPLSASFTGWFCRALLRCWLQARQEEAGGVLALNPPEHPMVSVEGADPILNQ